ncbi:hypothetical protein FOL46_003467 [Perkinsus olseni]|nr:hypothetical protein FOL46_003467 [Perkinsus olseni]
MLDNTNNKNNNNDNTLAAPSLPTTSQQAIDLILNGNEVNTLLRGPGTSSTTTRRTNFKRLALLVHPDKCKDDRAAESFRRLVDVMDNKGMEEEKEKEEGMYTWRWWEASTFDQRERLWSNLEEAFKREMEAARAKAEDRRRQRIDRKRRHAQAERNAVDTTDPDFREAAAAEVYNTYQPYWMRLSPFTKEQRRDIIFRNARSDDDEVCLLPLEEDIITLPEYAGDSSDAVPQRRGSTGSLDDEEEEEEDGPSRWVEGATGLGGSDIAVLSLGYAVGVCVRYLTTPLRDPTHILHSIPTTTTYSSSVLTDHLALQSYAKAINEQLLTRTQGDDAVCFWRGVAESVRGIKEGHRREVEGIIMANTGRGGEGGRGGGDDDVIMDDNELALMMMLGKNTTTAGSSSPLSSYATWKKEGGGGGGGGVVEVYCDTMVDEIRSKWLPLVDGLRLRKQGGGGAPLNIDFSNATNTSVGKDDSREEEDKVLIGMYEVVNNNIPIRKVAEDISIPDHHDDASPPSTASIWHALDRIITSYKDYRVLTRVCRMNLYWWWSQLIYHVHRERYHTTLLLPSTTTIRSDDDDGVLPSDRLFTFPNGRLNVDSCTQVPQLALIAGRYRLLRYVGCGGFARGYIAIDNDRHHPLATSTTAEDCHPPVDVFIKVFYCARDSPLGRRPSDNELVYRMNEVEKELTLSERILQYAPRLMCSGGCFVRVLAVYRGVKMECPLNKAQGRVSAVVTELCYGGNLKEIMDRHNTTPFTNPIKLSIARDLRSLIECLYGSDDIDDRYFHGDIKCDNLLVGRDTSHHDDDDDDDDAAAGSSGGGRIKLGDYGSIIRLTSPEAPSKYEHATHEYL